VAIPAVLDGWRLLGANVPAWVPLASALTKGVGVVWVWDY
jgi:hypothetical protein